MTTIINDLIAEDTPETDEDALLLLVDRINHVSRVLKKIVAFADHLDAPLDIAWYDGYIQALADFGTYLNSGERPE